MLKYPFNTLVFVIIQLLFGNQVNSSSTFSSLQSNPFLSGPLGERLKRLRLPPPISDSIFQGPFYDYDRLDDCQPLRSRPLKPRLPRDLPDRYWRPRRNNYYDYYNYYNYYDDYYITEDEEQPYWVTETESELVTEMEEIHEYM